MKNSQAIIPLSVLDEGYLFQNLVTGEGFSEYKHFVRNISLDSIVNVRTDTVFMFCFGMFYCRTHEYVKYICNHDVTLLKCFKHKRTYTLSAVLVQKRQKSIQECEPSRKWKSKRRDPERNWRLSQKRTEYSPIVRYCWTFLDVIHSLGREK